MWFDTLAAWHGVLTNLVPECQLCLRAVAFSALFCFAAGKRICENAVNRGYEVVSISGSGRKPEAYPREEASWIEKVNWRKGNVFRPETYRSELRDARAVVHSIGILLENDSYKKIVGSEDGVLNAVSGIFRTANPMAKSPDVTGNVVIDKTYERYNTESALVPAEALIESQSGVDKTGESSEAESVPAFVYVSADRGFPGIPAGYIESKRRTEYELYQLQPSLRPVILRPGFMYDPSEEKRTLRGALKSAVDVLGAVNRRLLFNALDGVIRPSVSTKVVAQWCVDKIDDTDFHGPVMLDEMINIRK